VHLEETTSATGFLVVPMGNSRVSQDIDHCLEARTNGRSFFRSLKPSAIDFPLQVQWIDRGHWTHRSVAKARLYQRRAVPDPEQA